MVVHLYCHYLKHYTYFEDAEATLLAVVGSGRFPCLFALALLTVLDLHVLDLERGFHAFGDATGV